MAAAEAIGEKRAEMVQTEHEKAKRLKCFFRFNLT